MFGIKCGLAFMEDRINRTRIIGDKVYLETIDNVS